nr:MAG TPA: hypothetical protein [Caudoviricetes sp.]
MSTYAPRVEFYLLDGIKSIDYRNSPPDAPPAPHGAS